MKLIVTEKDNVAARIAHILSGGKETQAGGKKGAKKSTGVPVYSYKDGDGDVTVIGLRGHILKVDFPEGYDNWEKTDLVDLVKAPLIKVPTVKLVMTALLKVAKGVDEVIIATDFDREGELIGVDAINSVKEKSPDVKVKRARFSSLTEKEIKDSFAHLEEPYYSVASAGEARQDIDLIWGATLTRGVSLASKRLGKNFLSVGRVQSPTLVLIAEREQARVAFAPEPYWQIVATLEKDGEKFDATHKKDRFLDGTEAKTIFDGLPAEVEVTSVVKRERSVVPPTPFNTTSFLTAASSQGFTASRAMSIAESLYMAGYISYPRTDNTVYPPSLDMRELLGLFTGSGFAEAAQKILAQAEIKPTRGRKQATDHPPIYPTGLARKEALDERSWKIYELVVRRFFGTLAPPARVESIKAVMDAGGQDFVARGERTIFPGWWDYYYYLKRQTTMLPDVKQGDILPIVDKQLLAKETQPPARYSQGALIQEMERLGLGTKATRHSIIKNLYDRQYVYGDPVAPTNLGMAMARSLKEFAATISSPNMTAELEKEMDNIAEGAMKRDQVVNDSRGVLVETVKGIDANQDEIRQRVWDGIRADSVVGKCPNCGSDLMIRRAKKSGKRFIGCSGYPDCTTAYSLPPFGMVFATGETCPECGAPMMKVPQKGRPPWVFCPNYDCPSKAEAKAKKAAKAAEEAKGKEPRAKGKKSPKKTQKKDKKGEGEVA